MDESLPVFPVLAANRFRGALRLASGCPELAYSVAGVCPPA